MRRGFTMIHILLHDSHRFTVIAGAMPVLPLQDTPVMQMSYDDPYSIIDLVKSAKCIINVAGPYMLTQGELMNLGLTSGCVWYV